MLHLYFALFFVFYSLKLLLFSLGPAQLCGYLEIGDILTAINGESISNCSFTEVLWKLRNLERPLTLRFEPGCTVKAKDDRILKWQVRHIKLK